VGELQLTAHIIELAVSVSQDYSAVRFGEENRIWSFCTLGGKFDGALRGKLGDGSYL
jgi:hypothetical protein